MLRGTSSITHMRWRRRLRSSAALLLLAAFALVAWGWLPPPTVAVPLVHVIDGDSLTARQDGETMTVRLTGLDAVEYRQDCGRADGSRWPCGREARKALEKLAGAGPLHCEIKAKDAYRRTLATCRNAPQTDGADLGAEMVRQGWAVATDDAYFIEESKARVAKRGIWQGDFVQPAEWRAAHKHPQAPLASTVPAE